MTRSAPVVGHSGFGAESPDGLGDGFRVGGATADVDVRAVGLIVDRVDLGAEAPEDLRAQSVRRPVSAVDHHPHPCQRPAGRPGEMPQVPFGGVLRVGDPTERSPLRTRHLAALHEAFHLMLDLVEKLRPSAEKNLMPLYSEGCARPRRPRPSGLGSHPRTVYVSQPRSMFAY